LLIGGGRIDQVREQDFEQPFYLVCVGLFDSARFRTAAGIRHRTSPELLRISGLQDTRLTAHQKH
jgi:hypothetical protein